MRLPLDTPPFSAAGGSSDPKAGSNIEGSPYITAGARGTDDRK
jgi:hypothetical protein